MPRRLLVVLAAVVVAAAIGVGIGAGVAPRQGDAGGGPPRAHNVIVVVGDGMGAAQRELIAARAGGRLHMDRLPVRGRVRTRSLDGVPDSAAAGTALATGVRTHNGRVGLDGRGRPHAALADVARASGRATGLVTTSTVSDATPAAFGGANVLDRHDQGEVARQLLEEGRVDVLLGGGQDVFAEHEDEALRLRYARPTTPAELRAARGPRVLGLFAPAELYAEDPEERPALADLTAAALRLLARDRDGFFLLVEDEGIDHFGHEGDADALARAGAELDRAVGVVLRFARRAPGTLVVVLGDHETGGLTLARGADGVEAAFSTGDHTAADVPSTAVGPGATRLRGTHGQTAVHRVLRDALR